MHALRLYANGRGKMPRNCVTDSLNNFGTSCTYQNISLVLIYPSLNVSGVRKDISLKVPRFRSFLLLLRGVLRGRRVWSIVGMTLTAKNRSSGRKTYFSVILCTRSLTWTVPRSNPGLCDFKTQIHLNYIYLLLSSKVIGEIQPHTTYTLCTYKL